MSGRLKARWGVNNIQLVLIILTFAIGGSLSGYAARKILLLLDLDRGPIWVIAYLAAITIIWPFSVLLISIPLGQLSFFRNYLGRVARRIGFGKAAKEKRKSA